MKIAIFSGIIGPVLGLLEIQEMVRGIVPIVAREVVEDTINNFISLKNSWN